MTLASERVRTRKEDFEASLKARFAPLADDPCGDAPLSML